jgi:hypothetical protein
MNSRLVIFFALFAVLCGSVLCNVEEVEASGSSSIKLHVFGSSSIWWIAIDPREESLETAKIEYKESSSSEWVTMMPNAAWGYWQAPSTSGRGFALPLSFRLTAANGVQVTMNSVLTNIAGGSLVDTRSQYPSGNQPTPPATTPTTTPTTKPTSAPTTRPTSAPTERPTSAPTERPTSAPTTRPSSAPTTRPTDAPSTPRPTNPPTEKPTNPPTQPSTPRPTTPATQAPTPRPTTPATQAPTTRPTTPATQAPTTRPTTPPNTDLCSIVPTSSEPIKILVPLYVYPGAAWDALVAVASKVKIIAIINPNSGPLTTVDATYSQYMTKLANAGVTMVGYVHTLYGARDLALVKSEIDTYASKYPLVKGIFLDEAANDAANVAYYTQVYNHIMSKSGYAHAILNPGVQPDQGYLPISTNIVIFENYASSLASSSYSNWVKCAPNAAQKAGYKYKFSAIIHTATLANTASYINTIHNQGMGLVYVTDGAGGCCTYNTLATYFAQEATSVATLNA